MAPTTKAPTPALVHWDHTADRPTRVRWGGHAVRVTRLASVRDERHAYLAERGPRLTMVVETSSGAATLVFDAAAGRWYVEGADQAA